MTLAEPLLIVGVWTFVSLRPVEGPLTVMPYIKAPTATEKMEYEFREDGTDRLRWELLNEGQFCERNGTFKWENNQLTSTVTELNPKNDQSCAADPDMVIGTVTVTPARIENNQLILTLPVSTEKAEIVFDRNPEWCPKDALRITACP